MKTFHAFPLNPIDALASQVIIAGADGIAVASALKTINGQSLLGAGNIAISVDLSGYLPIAGGTMAGNLDMDHYQISNVQAIDSDEITLNGLPVASEQYASNASNLTTGTVADARLSANVARRDQANTFAANQTITTLVLPSLSATVRSTSNPASSASSTTNMQTFLTQLRDGADVPLRGYRGRWIFDTSPGGPVLTMGDPAGAENGGFLGDGFGKPIGNGHAGLWAQHACRFWVGPSYVGTTNAIIGWNTSTTTWLDTYFKKTAVGSVSLCQNPSNTGEVAASLTVASLTVGDTGKVVFTNGAGSPYVEKYSNVGITVRKADGSLGSVNANELMVAATGWFYVSGRGLMTSSANGNIHIQNYDFNESVDQALVLGPGTSASNGVRFKRTVGTTTAQLRNGNDSADASLNLANLTASGVIGSATGSDLTLRAATSTLMLQVSGGGFTPCRLSPGTLAGPSQLGLSSTNNASSPDAFLNVVSAGLLSVTSDIGKTTRGSLNLANLNSSGVAKFDGYPTSLLPAAASNAGSITYDTTLSKHVGCNGSSWNALW